MRSDGSSRREDRRFIEWERYAADGTKQYNMEEEKSAERKRGTAGTVGKEYQGTSRQVQGRRLANHKWSGTSSAYIAYG